MAKAALDAFSPEEAARAARTVLEFLDEEWEGSDQIQTRQYSRQELKVMFAIESDE